MSAPRFTSHLQTDDLTHYPDGELPEEILAQYPVANYQLLEVPFFRDVWKQAYNPRPLINAENILGFSLLLVAFLACGGLALYSYIDTNREISTIPTSTPVSAGAICLAQSNDFSPVAIWQSDPEPKMVESINAEETISVIYQPNATIYYIFRLGQRTDSYVSVNDVELDCQEN